jgi:dihydrofolate synthase/folylpolyglutamate synthase
LLAAGYRVGAFTSPHLVRYNERIRINGVEAADEDMCQAFAAIDEARGDVSLSYFEFGTLAAAYLFSKAKVDVMLLEVGLGGRLDAVNIFDADVALITTVDLDHQDWLGEDRETIGYEKAGIMRAGRPAVFAAADMPKSVLDHAMAIGADLKAAGQDFGFVEQANGWDFYFQDSWRRALPYPQLRGRHQLYNASGALAVLAVAKPRLPVDNQAVRKGLQVASVAARFQVLQDKMPVVIDVAHNAEAMQVLRDNLRQFAPVGRVHLIVGMLKDKDAVATLGMLQSEVDFWYLVDTAGERGLSAAQLANKLMDFVPANVVQQHENVRNAYAAVLQCADQNDICVVTGSFLLAGEMLTLLQSSETRKTENG